MAADKVRDYISSTKAFKAMVCSRNMFKSLEQYFGKHERSKNYKVGTLPERM